MHLVAHEGKRGTPGDNENMSEKQEVQCPLCKCTYLNIARHLKAAHRCVNLKERTILVKGATGHINIRSCPCPDDPGHASAGGAAGVHEHSSHFDKREQEDPAGQVVEQPGNSSQDLVCRGVACADLLKSYKSELDKLAKIRVDLEARVEQAGAHHLSLPTPKEGIQIPGMEEKIVSPIEATLQEEEREEAGPFFTWSAGTGKGNLMRHIVLPESMELYLKRFAEFHTSTQATPKMLEAAKSRVSRVKAFLHFMSEGQKKISDWTFLHNVADHKTTMQFGEASLALTRAEFTWIKRLHAIKEKLDSTNPYVLFTLGQQPFKNINRYLRMTWRKMDLKSDINFTLIRTALADCLSQIHPATQQQVSTSKCHDTRTADRFYSHNPNLHEGLRVRDVMTSMLKSPRWRVSTHATLKAPAKAPAKASAKTPVKAKAGVKAMAVESSSSSSDSDSEDETPVPYQESGDSSSSSLDSEEEAQRQLRAEGEAVFAQQEAAGLLAEELNNSKNKSPEESHSEAPLFEAGFR
ncbi:hypothetical protein CRENBAI_007061 [Crenichthys baileyi]|uniref:Uncharacterized protein n=1 Tax=Crenichthys baileyi TaxID=28760 RepID=A0AAV9RMP1_9TELE